MSTNLKQNFVTHSVTSQGVSPQTKASHHLWQAKDVRSRKHKTKKPRSEERGFLFIQQNRTFCFRAIKRLRFHYRDPINAKIIIVILSYRRLVRNHNRIGIIQSIIRLRKPFFRDLIERVLPCIGARTSLTNKYSPSHCRKRVKLKSIQIRRIV